jgi:hypothetical protein
MARPSSPPSAKPPSSFDQQLNALPEDVRDRVLERAAILWDSGIAGEAANELAYQMETGRALPGLARARERDAEARTTSRSGTDD